MRGAKSDVADFGPALQATARETGGAISDAEKTAAFKRWEEDVVLLLPTDIAVEGRRLFEFRLFGLDDYGTLGLAVHAAVEQFSRIQAQMLHLS